MNPERQRIAIAEACGWEMWTETTGKHWWERGIHRPDGSQIVWGYECDPYLSWEAAVEDDCIPDYLNDLNAMHEAEMTLSPTPDELEICHGRYTEYLHSLCKVCGYPENERILFAWPIVTATAAQRAEAFLKTLNLWQDES